MSGSKRYKRRFRRRKQATEAVVPSPANILNKVRQVLVDVLYAQGEGTYRSVVVWDAFRLIRVFDVANRFVRSLTRGTNASDDADFRVDVHERRVVEPRLFIGIGDACPANSGRAFAGRVVPWATSNDCVLQ